MFYPTEDVAKGVKLHYLDEFKSSWDFLLVIVLIFSSLSSPYTLAFVDDDDRKWKYINMIVDICFTIDIPMAFNTAFFDDDYKIVDNRKTIACNYLKGWFLIDIGAVMPFELIFGSIGTYNGLVKMAKIGRLYKLIKLTRMLRVLKFLK
jgi:hypothetical protein